MITLCVVHSIYYLLSHFHNTIVFWKTAGLQLYAGIHIKDYENTICLQQMWDCMLVYASKIHVCEHLADNFFIYTILLSSCTEPLCCSPSSKPCCHLFLGWRICVIRRKWQWSSQMSRLHNFFLVPCRIYRWGLCRWIVLGWMCMTQHINPSVL